MKAIKLLSIIFILGISFNTVNGQEKKKTEKVTFKTSIDCDACVNTIMESVPLEKGIKDVKCDLETKEVMVEFKIGRTDKVKVKRMIEKLGYTAEEVKKKEEEKKENR